MKIAAPPCSFSCYNKDNPTGSDSMKYYVSSYSFSDASGPTSDVVSGDLYIDQIKVSAEISVKDPVTTYSGSAEFVFPATHWAFTLDGHATLAEKDSVTKAVSLVGIVAAVPVTGSFDITAEIVSSGQAVYDDWSPT
jgi:hypothetical protein